MWVRHKEEVSPTARDLHLVDSEGIIRFVRVNDLSAGRSVDEVLRVLDAVRSGQVSPCEWHSSEPTLAVA
jgi:lipoyl-dependent peroxiredoxin subunit C